MVLHIVLTVLKIIGIVVLALICVILALLLLVLFVPVRYRVSARWKGTDAADLYVCAELSWLLRLAGIRILLKNKQVSRQLLLFGGPPGRFRRSHAGKEERGEKTKEEKSAKGNTGDKKARGEEETSGPRTVAESAKPPDREQAGSGDGADVRKSPADEEKEKTRQASGLSGDDTEISREEPPVGRRSAAAYLLRGLEAVLSLTWRIPQLFLRIFDRVIRTALRLIAIPAKAFGWPFAVSRWKEKLLGRLEAVRKKIAPWKEWVQSEAFPAALRHVLRELADLLAHIRPRTLSGWVRVGFDDPSVTGELMGVLGMIYPVLPRKLTVTPVFDDTVIAFDVRADGRLYGIALVLLLLRLVLDESIRRTVRTRPGSGADAA